MNVAIKLPNSLDDKILTLPILHALHKELSGKVEEDEKLSIHLLSDGEGIDVLNLLPFHAYYHEFDAEDLKNIFTAHRACMNFKLDTVDIYMSLTKSFVDASLGKNFFAKRKIGFSQGKNNFFLNEKHSFLEGRHHTDQMFELLKSIFETPVEIPIVYCRDIEKSYSDWEANVYTVIDLNTVDNEIDLAWVDFIELFEESKFTFLCSELLDPDEREAKLSEFVKKLTSKNEYKTFASDSYIDFSKMIAFGKTFITASLPLINLACYCGQHCFYMNKGEDLATRGPLYFLGEVRDFRLDDSTLQDGDNIKYGAIFDEIYDYIKNH